MAPESDTSVAQDEILWGIEAALAADLVLDDMTKAEREAQHAARAALIAQARSEDEPESIPEAPRSVVDETPVVLPDVAEPVCVMVALMVRLAIVQVLVLSPAAAGVPSMKLSNGTDHSIVE